MGSVPSPRKRNNILCEGAGEEGGEGGRERGEGGAVTLIICTDCTTECYFILWEENICMRSAGLSSCFSWLGLSS